MKWPQLTPTDCERVVSVLVTSSQYLELQIVIPAQHLTFVGYCYVQYVSGPKSIISDDYSSLENRCVSIAKQLHLNEDYTRAASNVKPISSILPKMKNKITGGFMNQPYGLRVQNG